MTPFKDQPLARKALILGIVPTVFAVILVGVASMISTYLTVRRNLVFDLQAQATIIAENVTASLAFGDQASATGTLHAMRARPNVDAVCVFDANGSLFASFSQPGHLCAASAAVRDSHDNGASIVVEQAVAVGGHPLGTVRISGNLSVLYAWILTQSIVILGALIVGILVAVGLTRWIRKAVSSPVLDLAATADAISARRDYTLRATQSTNDEVGGLVRSFNAMLDEIQRRNEALTVEIAERKRAEHLKDEFLAAVSHELRTPLNAVLGWLQILRKTSPSPERIARALASLERNARSQARVIEDLLDVSRIVSGKLNMKVDVVDLRSTVAGAVDVMSTAAAARSIRISIATPDAPCLVSGDADRLQQVVLNVLANAVKFTPQGGHVAIALREAGPDGGDYELTVTDTGIGIAPEFLPHVFDRFRQADGSMTRQHGGLGLGLTIVKEVTELHGGSVMASSDGLGRGAAFTVRLPALVGVERAAPPPARPTPDASDALRGVHVLVVDDEPDGLEVAATALAEAGATVRTALSGGEGIDEWQRATYHALVCDLAMPGMDGFQVIARVREIDRGGTRRSVAVALTAYASQEYRDRSLAAGFHVHLAKPYNTNDLIAAIASHLDRADAPISGR